MMHALGFFHEQSRSDRNNYIYVAYGNMARTSEQDYRILQANAGRELKTSYDFFSLMHYDMFQGSKYVAFLIIVARFTKCSIDLALQVSCVACSGERILTKFF